MATLDVEAQDVLRIVLQFLREQKLRRSARALQDEADLTLNGVENADAFLEDVAKGRWDRVLVQAGDLKLPHDKLFMLYEQVLNELLEAREVDVARAMVLRSAGFTLMRSEAPDRFRRLTLLARKGTFDAREVYADGSNKERRRAELAAALATEVSAVPPGRLLSLLAHALKWQQGQGMLPRGARLDLLTGRAPSTRESEDRRASKSHGSIKFGAKSHATAAQFSRDGRFLATGSVEGFIELYDVDTCRISADLRYQAEDEVLRHESAVLALAFSKDAEMLASGSEDGTLKVWQVSTGLCLRKFERAHASGISGVAFSREGTHLATSSADNTVRVHGLRSGKTLKEMVGHTSFVNDVTYSQDGSRLLSASADGTIRIWDHRAGETLVAYRPPATKGRGETSTIAVTPLPRQRDQVVYATRADRIGVISLTGQAVKTFLVPAGRNFGDIAATTVSARGKFIYALTDANIVLCWSVETEKLVGAVKAHDKGEALGICHHPNRNIVATFTTAGKLKLWRAASGTEP